MKKMIPSLWWKPIHKGNNQCGPIYSGSLYIRKPPYINDLHMINAYLTDENSTCEYTTYEYREFRIDYLKGNYMIIDRRGPADEMIGRYDKLEDALNAIDTQIEIDRYMNKD